MCFRSRKKKLTIDSDIDVNWADGKVWAEAIVAIGRELVIANGGNHNVCGIELIAGIEGAIEAHRVNELGTEIVLTKARDLFSSRNRRARRESERERDEGHACVFRCCCCCFVLSLDLICDCEAMNVGVLHAGGGDAILVNLGRDRQRCHRVLVHCDASGREVPRPVESVSFHHWSNQNEIERRMGVRSALKKTGLVGEFFQAHIGQ